MLVVHAQVPLDPDSREDALEMIEDLAEQSRAEDGVIDYRATTEIGDPNTVRFIEQYEDEQALAEHAQTDHFQEFAAALPDVAAGEATGTQFAVSGSSELDL
jgi:quinol monooxygenase YgiN